MNILQMLKNIFKKSPTNKKVIITKENADVLPSPIAQAGHYIQTISLFPSNDPEDKLTVLTTKNINIQKEKLRWCKIPNNYCSNPDKYTIVFKDKSFVTITYLYWLLQTPLKLYQSPDEFWNNVTIYGSTNKQNFKSLIDNYYSIHK